MSSAVRSMRNSTLPEARKIGTSAAGSASQGVRPLARVVTRIQGPPDCNSRGAEPDLASLLRPEDSALILIDHQPYQLANVNSHEPQAIVNKIYGESS